MRVLFMGTPDFAVPTLQTLMESEHEVIGVVTQPDKPKGRGGKLQFSPVKEAAVAAGIPVYQPARVRDEAFLFEVRRLYPDVIVVVAFGQILSKEILDIPEYGCLNVHASLLPKLRGAAPIQWSVIQGDRESGVTIMQMDEGLDTGDILMTQSYTLGEKETGVENVQTENIVLDSETTVPDLEETEPSNDVSTICARIDALPSLAQ